VLGRAVAGLRTFISGSTSHIFGPNGHARGHGVPIAATADSETPLIPNRSKLCNFKSRKRSFKTRKRSFKVGKPSFAEWIRSFAEWIRSFKTWIGNFRLMHGGHGGGTRDTGVDGVQPSGAECTTAKSGIVDSQLAALPTHSVSVTGSECRAYAPTTSGGNMIPGSHLAWAQLALHGLTPLPPHQPHHPTPEQPHFFENRRSHLLRNVTPSHGNLNCRFGFIKRPERGFEPEATVTGGGAKPLRKLSEMLLMARRSCDARSRSLRCTASTNGRASATT
jgi:hypothetical protein